MSKKINLLVAFFILLLLAISVHADDSYVEKTQKHPELGDSTNDILIEGYMGYEDPFSQRSWSTITALVDKYEDDVYFRFINVPLSFHSKGNLAAIAGECVYAESGDDAFFEFSTDVFENIDGYNSSDSGRADLIIEAKLVGADITTCLESSQIKSFVTSDIKQGEEKDVTGTPTFFINGKKIIGSQPYDVFDTEIRHILGKDIDYGNSKQKQPELGYSYNDILIEGYMGYEDPFSQRSWPTITTLVDKYEDDVYFRFINMPLSFHSNGNLAAVAGECVYAESGDDAFFKFSTNVFKNIGTYSSVESDLIKEASKVGADISTCLGSSHVQDFVDFDIKQGEDKDVTGTPTFFINGERIVGAQSYETFVAAIESKLDSDSEDDSSVPSNDHETVYRCPHIEVQDCSNGKLNIEYDVNNCVTGIECIKTIEDAEDVKDTCTNGCTLGESCLPIGTRAKKDDISVYCSYDVKLVAQSNVDENCQNDYECTTNSCQSGTCLDLANEIKETKSMLSSILEWFKSMFR